jgi:DNA-binding MarR family transcriptional regulator
MILGIIGKCVDIVFIEVDCSTPPMEHTLENICSPRMMKTYLDKRTIGPLEDIGLTVAGAQFLGAIYYNDGASMRELSDMLSVDKAHATRTVQKLIEDGLVEDTGQGHAYSLHVTQSGTEAVKVSKRIFEDAWRSMLRDLTPEEMEVLRTIISKAAKVIKEDSE